jgi:hypothetical protein
MAQPVGVVRHTLSRCLLARKKLGTTTSWTLIQSHSAFGTFLPSNASEVQNNFLASARPGIRPCRAVNAFVTGLATWLGPATVVNRHTRPSGLYYSTRKLFQIVQRPNCTMASEKSGYYPPAAPAQYNAPPMGAAEAPPSYDQSQNLSKDPPMGAGGFQGKSWR